MFVLPKPMFHVSSAAFAQARLRPGSSSAQVAQVAQVTQVAQVAEVAHPITRRGVA
jgi:hypothetical protein